MKYYLTVLVFVIAFVAPMFSSVAIVRAASDQVLKNAATTACSKSSDQNACETGYVNQITSGPTPISSGFCSGAGKQVQSCMDGSAKALAAMRWTDSQITGCAKYLTSYTSSTSSDNSIPGLESCKSNPPKPGGVKKSSSSNTAKNSTTNSAVVPIATVAASTQSGSQATTTTDTSASAPGCDASGISLSWILCPIIEYSAKAADGIYANLLQPLLQSKPIDTTNDAGDPTHLYKIWSNFRVYGDIFLVFALLVIVFGESLGGGMVDAYTVKKVLPRLLLAAILINISIYLVALAVDLTNIAGQGIAALIEAPFKSSGAYAIHIGGTTGDLGMVALVGGISAAVWAGSGALISYLFVFFLVPVLLTILAILVTVILRQGLIVLLVLVSPVAFALYCLPNTEKYFRQWWNLLLRTLLIYPLISLLFALANILAITISSSASGLSGAFAGILSMIALFVPLFLIPFSFKITGGLLQQFHDFATNKRKQAHESIKGNANDPWSLQNRKRYALADQYTKQRERVVDWSKNSSKGSPGVGRRGIGRLANYGNLQAKRARYNKERSEITQGQIGTGDDSNIRDLFLEWDANAQNSRGGTGGWFRRMDMDRVDGALRAAPGAKEIYSDFNVGKQAHAKSMSLYGGDKSTVQDALYYEWKKTGFEPAQMERVEDQMPEILQEHGFNKEEGGGMMKGVGFRHAQQSLVSKYSSYKPNDDPDKSNFTRDYIGLTKEGTNNLGTFGWANQDRRTFDVMAEGHEKMTSALSGLSEQERTNSAHIFNAGDFEGKSVGQVAEAKDRLERLADELNPAQPQPMNAGRPMGMGQGDDGQPIMAGRGISSAPVNVQAAAIDFYNRVRGGRGGQQTSQPPDSLPGGPNFQ